MSKLKWDQTEERLYETGVSQGVVYPQDSSGAYPTGYAWNGLSTFTMSPSGAEPNDIYADNMKYLTLRSAEDNGGTIEAYMWPDAFDACNGAASPVTGLRLTQQNRLPFGFVCKTILGNDTELDAHGYKLHLVYNATVSPSEASYQTVNDSPEAITFSWEFTTLPVAVSYNNVDYKPTAYITIDSTKAGDHLTDLEDILFGKDASSASAGDAIVPHLPSPSDVIAILAGTYVPPTEDEEDEDVVGS